MLSPDELREAREAAYAYTDAVSKGEPLPKGFSAEPGTVLSNGFAFHPSLARLAVHPSVLPIIRELCGGQPQLRRGSLLWDHSSLSSSDGVPLHSGREDYPENNGGCGTARKPSRCLCVYTNSTSAQGLAAARPARLNG